MSHYSKSRLSTRTSSTPPAWLKTCSQIGQLVNTWSGRNDLAVYAGEDAVQGIAIAAFYMNEAEIEINLPNAFGKATTPSMVGDITLRANQFDWAEPVGVIYHEALHAKYSEWNKALLHETDEKTFRTFQLLDESRIERKGVVQMPENALFLRASAMNLALNELNDETVAMMSDIRACASASALALARVDAGVLKLSDVQATYDKVVEVIGQDLFNKLRAIWVEFQSLSTSQTDTGIELAKKWNDLLKEADPEGEQPQEGGSTGSDFLDELLEAMEGDAGETAMSNSMDMADQQTKEDWKEEVKQRNSQSKRQNETKKDATEVFSKATGSMGSSSRSSLTEQRNPTGKERSAAVQIAKMLEKAKYRERSETVLKSHEPKGRLKARVLVQNSALKDKGSMNTNPAWRHKTRKHNDDPTLRMGIMVDISGSMSSAMEAMATTAWVLGEAGRRVQAKTAMVYYGSDVFATLKVGQKLDKVSVYSAPDGTEKFGKAFSALDGSLDLVYGDGVRMLVVVSDGHYTSEETNKAKETARLCRENGVAVLWITPKECMGGMATHLLEGYGVVLDKMETDQIAIEIGRAAALALEKSAVV
jgi:hypothetical protein